MPTDSELPKTPKAKPELRQLINVYVLFIDIIGFSKLNLPDQLDAIQRLEQIIKSTRIFRLRDTEELLILATGDGMALVFFTKNVIPAVECAHEVAGVLAQCADDESDDRMALRLGIHMGPVFSFHDINGRRNVAGEGINIAQRVMDCGDAGHILLSDRVTSQLKDGVWDKRLKDLGKVNVKHNESVHLFSLCDGAIGNAEPPIKVKEARKLAENAERAKKHAADEAERRWGTIAAIVMLVSLLTFLGVKYGTPDPPRMIALELMPFQTNDVNFLQFSTRFQLRLAEALKRPPTLIPANDKLQYPGDDPRRSSSNQKRWSLTGNFRKVDGKTLRLEVRLKDNSNSVSMFEKGYVIDLTDANLEDPFVGDSVGSQALRETLADLAAIVRSKLTPKSMWCTEDEEGYRSYVKNIEYNELKKGSGH